MKGDFGVIHSIASKKYMINSFYTQEELLELGFKSVGQNVLISKKASLYSISNMSIGNNVRIDDFCLLSGKIVIGNYVHIAAFVALFGGSKGIFLEDFSGLSSKATVYAVSDDYSGEVLTNPTIPDKYKNLYEAPVMLRKHVIIGAGCIVLPGVELKEGSAFGAMSLITKDSMEWSINCGCPAKKIKDRKVIKEVEEQFLKDMNN